MSTKNLMSKEAIAKLKELSEKARTCMFMTDLKHQPVTCRPMSLNECDEQGNLWFISSSSSNKNFEIGQDDNVQLIFMNNGDSEYLSIYGKAEIFTDKSIIDDKWTVFAKPWFKEGKDDPDVSVIRVIPDESYYWDTKAGKFISMLSFAAAAITGKETDNSDGIEGKLNI